MSESDPPAKKIDDQALLAAVERACELNSIPVATSGGVARLDGVNIDRQQARDRLKKLAGVREENPNPDEYPLGAYRAGGWVFWLPDEAAMGGEVDAEAVAGDVVDWKRTDPGRIPDNLVGEALAMMDFEKVEEFIGEHPEYDQPSKLENWMGFINNIAGLSSISLLLGLGVFAIQDTQFQAIVPDVVYNVAAAVLIAGAVFLAPSVPLLIVLRGVKQGSQSRFGVAVAERFRDYRNQARLRLPSLEITWRKKEK